MTAEPAHEHDEAEAAAAAIPDAELEPDGDDGDDGDDDGGDGQDEAPAAEQRPAMSQADVEKRMGQLDNEAARHAKRVAEIMGDDFGDLIPNPCDWTPGFLVNPQLAPIPAEVLAAFDAIVGRGSAGDLEKDPTKERCNLCKGKGMLRTDSFVENQDKLPCGRCFGKGWREVTTEAAAVPQPLVVVGGNGGQPSFSGAPVAADRWGRPFGHPHYNIDPASVGV